MIIIIGKDGIKRRITVPFQICGSREDIKKLVTQLYDHLARDDWSYGWLNICEEDVVMPNTPVKDWSE